jgi:hypothetical protein
LGSLEGVRVETHERVKYYGYFGEDGSPVGWEAGANDRGNTPTDNAQGNGADALGKAPLDEAKRERLQAMLRMVMQEVKAKRGKGGTGRSADSA